MVVPPAQSGATAVGFEQFRFRLVGRFAYIEMRRHPPTAVVAEHVVRDGRDIDPVPVEDRDAHISERQDPDKQRQVDPTT